MQGCVPALISYFENELPALKENYQWKIPKIDGFHRCEERSYEANVELKKYLSTLWSTVHTK